MSSDFLIDQSRNLSPNNIVAEFLALSVVEFSYNPTIDITIHLDRASGKISDNGRGMRLTPDAGDTISHAERALTSIYPCLAATPEINAVLQSLIWKERGSLGPAPANFACPSLHFYSNRNGQTWSQSYHFGTPTGIPIFIGPTKGTGTTIQFETTSVIDRASLAILIQSMKSQIQRLNIQLIE